MDREDARVDALAPLRAEWRRLTGEALPAAVVRRPQWPVRLDHCFARIILDAVYEKPWREAIRAPAWRNMEEAALGRAIDLAQAILDGRADLAALNRRSLRLRGKAGSVHPGGEVV